MTTWTMTWTRVKTRRAGAARAMETLPLNAIDQPDRPAGFGLVHRR